MLSHDGVAELLRPRVVFATIAAAVLWVCYAASILLYPARAWDGSWRPDGWLGAFNVKEQVVLADHMAFYTAARLVREGDEREAYNYEFVAGYQSQLFPSTWGRPEPFAAVLGGPAVADRTLAPRWNSLEAFRNPPFYALLYVPTAGWQFQHSSWFWAAVQIGLLWVSIQLLTQSPRTAVRGLSPTKAFLWSLTFYPVFAAVSFGQNTLLSLFALALCYRLLSADRRFLAGLAAGLLCFKPPLLLGLVVWGLVDIRRMWPCALGVVVTGAVLCGASYPLVPDMWAGFVESLGKNTAFDNFHQFKMHNPIAFWRLLLPDVSDRVRWPLAAALSLAAVGCFVWLWRTCRHDLPAVFGGAVFLTLWASPHALIYEWALLLVPAVLWWPKTPSAPNRWFVLYAVGWVVLFVSTHLSEGQQLVQNLLGAADPHGDPTAPGPLSGFAPLQGLTAAAVQLSVPVLGWVGWSAARLLRESCPKPSP